MSDAPREAENLPALRKGAGRGVPHAIGYASAIAGLFIPGVGFVETAIRQLIERRLRQAEEILVQKLEKEGVAALDDENAAEFVPSAFKFYTAARDGEVNRILNILSARIAKRTRDKKLHSSDIKILARSLEGLTENDIELLCEIRALNSMPREQGKHPPDLLVKILVPSVFLSVDDLRARQGILQGRGLIVVKETYISGELDFKPSPYAESLFVEIGEELRNKAD